MKISKIKLLVKGQKVCEGKWKNHFQIFGKMESSKLIN
jgi:hypothetical protein